jgi:glycerol-3-phosphate dehydrogenase
MNANPASILSPQRRHADLAAAERTTFDVVVIGGGVTGTGIALDAATRGLSVCLVEQRDLAAGTSSRSSKLVHGGLRYLEQKDFRLVWEALHERKRLLRDVAPHLVRALPFLLPLRAQFERAYIGAGVALYDVLAGRDSAVPRHRHLSRQGCLDLVPSLEPKAFIGGITYYDAQVDDARHTTEVGRTAAAHGARILTGVKVVGVSVEGGRAVGVEVCDVDPDSGEGPSDPFVIKARCIVNATGVWTSKVEELAGITTGLTVRAAKGIHVLIPKERIQSSTGMILRTEKSVLFMIPWGDRWIIGTTDTDWQGGLDHPAVSAADVDYVLHWANTVLSSRLTTADVIGTYAGLRPLVSPVDAANATTAKISREHAVVAPIPGFVSIAGGKYTTYRIMAADAVDMVATQLPFAVGPSRTDDLPLLGAVGHESARARLRAHAAGVALGDHGVEHLAARYGSLALELADLIALEPALAQPVGDGAGEGRYLRAEIVHAVTHEGARHVDDVLTRRTRLYIEAADRGRAAAPEVAQLMGAALEWTRARVARETAHYTARVDAELVAQTMPDDASAEAARNREGDLRFV